MLELDRLVVLTTDLDAGQQEIEDRLNAPMEDGGRNKAHGTRSKLLSLGPNEFLELVGSDADCAPPSRARWYALDRFSGETRLANWVVRTNELSHLISLGAAGPGMPLATSRDGMRGTMVVPDDGELGMDGIAPALVEWRNGLHPAQKLPDHGIRLTSLKLSHPRITTPYLPDDPRVESVAGDYGISALLETNSGAVQI